MNTELPALPPSHCTAAETMELLLANTGTPLLLVNLVFAVIALGVGFAAGAWVCGGQSSKGSAREEEASAAAERLIELERAMMASDRLRDLAASVASDVGTHNANIGAIEQQLAEAKASDSPNEEAVTEAVGQIEQANAALQAKLAKAEQQIQAQAEQIKTHESEARTDSLTKLSNRRAFDDELARRFSEWERKSTPFSLLILDVDHFKKFNDTHGHQAGDEVLRKVGAALTKCARDMDLPCRYGGEEFAIVMPATKDSDGNALGERVRTTIERMRISFEGKTLNVTTSLGLATVDSDDDVTSLIKRADEALYVAKDAGRNNGHRHTGDECVPITAWKAKKKEAAPAADIPATAVLDRLPNRTRFLEILRNEVRNAQNSGDPLSVISAELEGYSKLEEEFGEAVAKLTLDSIAQFLDGSIQENDQLGRLNDGQFILLLHGQRVDEAQQVRDRIKAALANCTIPLGNTQLRLTTAMSVTQLTEEDSAVSFMQRAERLLKTAAPGTPAAAV